MGKLQADALALFIERAFSIEDGIDAAYACAGVAQKVDIHGLFTL